MSLENQDLLKRLELILIPTLLAILMWLVMLTIEFNVYNGDNLGASWREALDYAVLQRLQFGVDIIFTYGPLAFLYHPAGYNADLLLFHFVWQFLGLLLIASLFVMRGYQLDSGINRVVYFACFIVLLTYFPSDSGYFLTVVGLASLALMPPQYLMPFHRYAVLLVIIASLLAVLSLIKFTVFVLAVFSIAIIAGVLILTRAWLLGLVILSSFVIALLSLWVLAGQALEHLPVYILRSLEMSRAYSETMALGFQRLPLLLAASVVFIINIMLLLAVVTAKTRLVYLGAGLIALAGTFFAAKTGFVRQDEHMLVFFGYAVLVPWLLACDNQSAVIGRLLFNGLRYLAVAIAVLGLLTVQSGTLADWRYMPLKLVETWNHKLVANVEMLLTLPERLTLRRQQLIALRQAQTLPKTSGIVGNATIDVVSWSQRLIFINQFNWQPRPTIQSYAAYTPKLMRLNGEIYAGPQAPDYVLWQFQNIDRQLPMMNDAEVHKLLLRDYKPLLAENGYLLLAHQPRGEGLVEKTQLLLQQRITPNMPIDLTAFNAQSDSKPQLLTLDIPLSWQGELLKLGYRLPPAIYLEITLREGQSQYTARYRVLPSMLKTGVLLNPFLANQNDLYKWFSGGTLAQVESLQILIEPAWINHLIASDKMVLEIAEVDLTPYPLSELKQASFKQYLYPSLGTPPEFVSRPNQASEETGQPVLMVHSPGEVHYALESGTYQLNGEFGILQGAYAASNAQPTDGVTFVVVVKQDTASEAAFSRTLNPRWVVTDQGIQTLPELQFSLDTAGVLILRTDPFADTRSDWSFWRAIELDRLD